MNGLVFMSIIIYTAVNCITAPKYFYKQSYRTTQLSLLLYDQ